MRIIAGSRKGARIFAPKGETRPTGDRVREAAFNLIGPVDEMAGARPLRRLRGDGPRGALARSRDRGLRRVRPRGSARDRAQPREARASRERGSSSPTRGAHSPPKRPRAVATISSSSTRPTGCSTLSSRYSPRTSLRSSPRTASSWSRPTSARSRAPAQPSGRAAPTARRASRLFEMSNDLRTAICPAATTRSRSVTSTSFAAPR